MRIFPEGIPIIKRLFDIVVASLCTILFSPLLAFTAILVRFYHGSPVLFSQERGGYRGIVFKVYKFRSMSEARDRKGNLLPDTQRLSRFGRFIRSTSIDELPELFNVLKGEMSLVGPRPLFARYLDRYEPEHRRRHEVLPGITGWAQVNGRNEITWEEKFNLDVWYVDHWSFILDLRILWLTFIKVVRREGISQPGYTSAEEYFPEKEANPDKSSKIKQ